MVQRRHHIVPQTPGLLFTAHALVRKRRYIEYHKDFRGTQMRHLNVTNTQGDGDARSGAPRRHTGNKNKNVHKVGAVT